PDAVEARGMVVALGLELAAGMERRQDQLERGLLVLRMTVDRDATSVVGDRGGRAVLVQRDGDAIGVAVHRLVDPVVDHLPQQMMQAGRVRATDVPPRRAAPRLEAFQDQDALRGVARPHPLPPPPPPRFQTHHRARHLSSVATTCASRGTTPGIPRAARPIWNSPEHY